MTVTYGNRAELCLQTVRHAFVSGVTHVIVVDNGSFEGPALAAAFDGDQRVSLMSTGRNLGSAGGFAAGIAAAVRRHEDYVLLLDDDNILGPSSVGAAVRLHLRLVELTGNPRLVVVCMRTSNSLHRMVAQGRPVRHVYPPPGSFLSLDLLQRLMRPFWGRCARLKEPAAILAIPVAPYGGLLMARGELEHVGGPDPRLTLYEDDTAWTSGLTRLGYRLVLCPDAPVDDAEGKWLDGGDSGRGPLRMLRSGSEARRYYSVRNRVLFDFGRASTLGTRLRYYANRSLFLLYVHYVGRGTALASARRAFGSAVRDGEAQRLNLGPGL